MTKVSRCFICNGPHRAKDCLEKEKLNALMVFAKKKGED